MQSKSSGIGWLLVFGMGIMGLAGMPNDPPSATSKTSSVHQPEPRKKSTPSSAPPEITCDGDDCWWTDQGRPSK